MISTHRISSNGVEGQPIAIEEFENNNSEAVGSRLLYLHPDAIDSKKNVDYKEMKYMIRRIIDDVIKVYKMRVSDQDQLDLENSVISSDPPVNKILLKIYNEVQAVLDYKFQREYSTKGSSLFPYPIVKKGQRASIYVSGASGSGKSYWCAQYAIVYKSIFPDHKLYLFSCKKSDPVFDEIPELNRIELNKDFIDDVANNDWEEQYSNSLCIFDDVEMLKNKQDKAVYNSLKELKSNILTLGRSANIDIISIVHKGLSGDMSKIELSEANQIVLFPTSNMNESRKIAKTYIGLDATQIKRLMKDAEDSRWILINRTYPPFVVTKKSIYLIKTS